MSIFVLLSPIHFFPYLSFLELLSINLKTILFSFKREIIITSLFKKLTKISRNNFKIDIKGISARLKMCKNIISAYFLIHQAIRIFYPMFHLKHKDGPTVNDTDREA